MLCSGASSRDALNPVRDFLRRCVADCGGWFALVYAGAHSVEDVFMQLMGHKLLQRPPEPAWMQKGAIAGRENNVALVAAVVDLIRPALRDGTAFDS